MCSVCLSCATSFLILPLPTPRSSHLTTVALLSTCQVNPHANKHKHSLHPTFCIHSSKQPSFQWCASSGGESTNLAHIRYSLACGTNEVKQIYTASQRVLSHTFLHSLEILLVVESQFCCGTANQELRRVKIGVLTLLGKMTV